MHNGKFPRTLHEAFNDAEAANPFEGFDPYADNRNTWGGVVLAVVIGLVGAWVLIVGLSK